MRNFTLNTFTLLMLSTVTASALLIGCGSKEKAADPFGTARSKQTGESELTPKDFQKLCKEKNGTFSADMLTCKYTSKKFVLSADDKKKLNEEGLFEHNFLKVTQGALVWGQVKGGQRVTFYRDGAYFEHMDSNRPLTPTPTNAGELKMLVYAGEYEFLNAYVAECFTSKNSVPCAP